MLLDVNKRFVGGFQLFNGSLGWFRNSKTDGTDPGTSVFRPMPFDMRISLSLKWNSHTTVTLVTSKLSAPPLLRYFAMNDIHFLRIDPSDGTLNKPIPVLFLYLS